MGKVRLMDQVRDVIRVHDYSLRTEFNYSQWIKQLKVAEGLFINQRLKAPVKILGYPANENVGVHHVMHP